MIDFSILNRFFKTPPKRLEWSYIAQETPRPYRPVVTQKDYREGVIQRYFVRRANTQDTIIEVDKAQYTSLKKNPRYATAVVRWKIRGRKDTTISSAGAKHPGTEDINRQRIIKLALTMPGITNYISDYTEFWQGE